MNNSADKLWFLYKEDHHEGPFSLDELQEMKKAGSISASTYTWKEGQADWEMIQDTPEIAEALFPKPAPSSGSESTMVGVLPRSEESQPEPKPQSAPTVSPSLRAKRPGKSLVRSLVSALVAVVFVFGLIIGSSHIVPSDVHNSLRPLYLSIASKSATLERMIQILPKPNDLSQEELDELESALLVANTVEPRITLLAGHGNPARPNLYVTSNLPDKTDLTIELVGNPDTLLNELTFNRKIRVVLDRGFARSEALIGEEGKPIPQGEYSVAVMETAQGDGASSPGADRFVMRKILFLNGEKDNTYLAKLKTFQDKIKEASSKELSELTQYESLLRDQFESVRLAISKSLTEKPAPKTAKKKVKKAKPEPVKSNKELVAKIQSFGKALQQVETVALTWTDASFKDVLFYGSIYRLLKDCLPALRKYFEVAQLAIESPADKVAFRLKESQNAADASKGLGTVKAKLMVVKNAPKSAAGLPLENGAE